MLRMDSVSKKYLHRGQYVTALDNASVSIPKGDFVSLVGPSGSGKSTLLLMLGGMLSPTSGQVYLDDQSLYALSPNGRAELRKQKLGFVFQTFNLVPYLTALENVQVPLYLAGVEADAQRDQAMALLERLGLGERIHHKPCELSVGQQQRVALARMLANDPAVVLADVVAAEGLDDLIHATGAESVDYPGKTECCAGPVMGIREKVTWDVGIDKVQTLKKHADAMATCCPFCYITYERCQFMTEVNPNLPVVHIPQLLGLAMGLTADEVGLSANKVDASSLLAKQEA